MSIGSDQKLDAVYKKITGYVAETSVSGKEVFNENISSPLIVFNEHIWGDSAAIPIPASGASTSIAVKHSTTSSVQCLVDPTVAGYRTWVAVSSTADPIDSSNILKNWIPPFVDPTYLIQVYSGNPSTTGVLLNPVSAGYEFIFDYAAGVLHFPNTVPSSVSSNGIYLVGYTYDGILGVSGSTGGAGGHTIQNSSSANMTARTYLRFSAPFVTTDVGATATDVSLTSDLILNSLSAAGITANDAVYIKYGSGLQLLNSSNVNTFSIYADSITANYEVHLPPNAPNAGEVLIAATGSDTWSWGPAGGMSLGSVVGNYIGQGYSDPGASEYPILFINQNTGALQIFTDSVRALSFNSSTADPVLSAPNVQIWDGGGVRFRELDTNGGNYVQLKAPASVTGNVTYTLPGYLPSSDGMAITSTTAGVMGWGSAGGGGHTIKTDGTPLTNRAGLNFSATFEVTDDAGNDETDVAIGTNKIVYDMLDNDIQLSIVNMFRMMYNY